MSHWLNRFRRGALRVALAPDRVEFVAAAGGGATAQHGSIPVTAQSPLSWEPAIQALGTLLERPENQGRQLRVVLSDAWAAYRVLPWDASLSGRSQWERYASAVFQDGQAGPEEWVIALEPPWPCHNVVACRSPAGLVAAIRVIAQQNHSVVDSIQPFFVASINRYRPRTPASDFWWVAMDGFRMVTGLWRNGAGKCGTCGWQVVRNTGCGENADPQAAVMREALQIGLIDDSLPIIVCCRHPGGLPGSGRVVLAGAEVQPDLLFPLAA